MQRLRFICENAKMNEARVAAVNDGEPLVYGEIYTVSNELADELLKNEDDWRQLSPPDSRTKEAEPERGDSAEGKGDA